MALRTPLSVTPHLYMGDSTGRPLDKGVVYFGEQDKDPEFYPITLYSDDALTLPLAQPVHTKGGYLYDKGDMVEPHAKEIIYSVKVLDSYGRKVFYKGAMMRNSWNDDVIEQINTALVSTAEEAAQIATDVAKEIADKAVISSGFVTIDSFELGATLTQRNQALRHAADGKLYRWAGDLPKVVTVDSTPATSGGMGDNAWLEVSDVTLRQDLANPAVGAAMMGRGVVAVDSIADLLALPEGQKKAGLRYLVLGYYAETTKGGGEFYWDQTRSKADHNGCTVFDPLKAAGWDGKEVGFPGLYEPSDLGTGCFIRVVHGKLSGDMAGLVADDYAVDQFDALRGLLKGISQLAVGAATPRDVDVFISGGFRVEVKSTELRFPNARYFSDKKAIRLPFTEAHAATDPGYAASVWGGEYHNFDFDGFRKSGGVGTSPSVPSSGQGAVIVFSGAKSFFYGCAVHGGVYPNMVTYSPEKAPTLVDTHIYDSGEHLCYFSGSSDGVRFIRCRFGNLSQNPDQGSRAGHVWRYRPDTNPEVDAEFIDCIVDVENTGPFGQTALLTNMESHGAQDWKLGRIVIDGLTFTERDQTARLANIGLDDGAVISNIHLRNISNCPVLFQGISVGSGVIFTANTAKNIEFRSGCEGITLFDYAENISIRPTNRLSYLGPSTRPITDVFKKGSVTKINGLSIADLSGNGLVVFDSYVGRDVIIENLAVDDSGIGVRNEPLQIGDASRGQGEASSLQRYILRKPEIITDKTRSIRLDHTIHPGGVELELDGGFINKPLHGTSGPVTLILKNGFKADYVAPEYEESTLVRGTKPLSYSSDPTCVGVGLRRVVTMPADQTSINVPLGEDVTLKIRGMETASRASPLGSYSGEAWTSLTTNSHGVNLNLSVAPTEDTTFLVEVFLYKQPD